MSGKLIVFEGIDGCGKTTQLNLCAKWLRSLGLPVLTTQQPGATLLGREIRSLILDEKYSISPVAELLMYSADRYHHVTEVIKPALAKDEWVLCDRFTQSTIAYQGYGRGISQKSIREINDLATGGVKCDYVVWLEVSYETAFSRKGKKLDRIEQENYTFYEKVMIGYQRHMRLAEDNYGHFDGELSIGIVHKKIKQSLSCRFSEIQEILRKLEKSSLI